VRYSERLFPKNWSSVRWQSIRQLPDSRRLLVFRTWTGQVGPRLLVKVKKKMVVHSPTTSSKKIQPDLLLTGADGSTTTIKCHLRDSFGLKVYKPAGTHRLTPSMKAEMCLCKASPRFDHLKVEEDIIDGLQSYWTSVFQIFAILNTLHHAV